METQKIANLLDDTNSESSKLATRKWYVINDKNNTEYGEGNKNDSSIKFETKVIKLNLCDYSDAYILVTGDITGTGGDANTRVAFKSCAPLLRCVSHINDEHIDTAENLVITMPISEYSDNYSDTSGSLRQFKRDESDINIAGNTANITTLNSTSSKCKSSILGNPAADGAFRNVKIVVPLKYFSNFWGSLINCKAHLELNWTKNCVVSDIAGETTFKITNTKLYVPIVTFSTKDNVNLTKQFNEGFKRSVYWNEYKIKKESKDLDNENCRRFYLGASFQGVKSLFILAFNNSTVNFDGNPINNINNRVVRDNHRKYFLLRVHISSYNVLIDGRNFYDQPINGQIKNYDEIRKITTGQGDDYATGCLLDYKSYSTN